MAGEKFFIPDGRSFAQIFAPGNAGIVTRYFDPSGTDLGNLFAAGNSGVVTRFFNPAGTDLGNLFAGSGGSSQLTPGAVPTFISDGVTSGTATASMLFQTTGGISGSASGTWALPVTGSLYEVSWAAVSGTMTNTPAAAGVFVGLGTLRTFSLVRSVAGVTTAVIDITVRRIAAPTDTFTVRVTFEAEIIV